MKRALFLDRDGVINKDKSYVFKIEDFEFCDGIFDFCREALAHNFIIVVITNQSGIERGYYTQKDFNILSNFMLEKFREQNIEITDIFHCPTLSGYDRKPNPGMFKKAAAKYSIQMKSSVSVGDKQRDIEAALNAGIIRNYLISDNSSNTKCTKAFAVVKSLRDIHGAFDF